MNIFIEEMKLNKKSYTLTLLWFMVINSVAFFFLESIVAEYYGNIYRFMIFIVFWGSFSKAPVLKKEKVIKLYAKLPLTIRQLFIIRIIRTYIIALAVPFFLSILYFVDKKALSFETFLFMLICIYLTITYWVYEDVKVITESSGIFKRMSFTAIALIVLLIPLVAYIFILKSNEFLSELIYVNLPFLVLYTLFCFTISFLIFKKRKNYKS